MPGAQTVDHEVRRWAEKTAQNLGDVQRNGHFGSYARGDWGAGSDLDLIVVLRKSEQPFDRRGAQWDVNELSVPADVLVYTQEEWQFLNQQKSSFSRLAREAVWVFSWN